MDEWDKLRHGHSGDAIRQLRDEYSKRRKNPSLAIKLGVTYLWLRDWQDAWEHFCSFTEVYSWTTDFAFKFAGTAKWCANEKEAAVADWKKGIDCEYADMAGGVTIPLLLFFAATVQPDLMSMEEAIKLLRNRAMSKHAISWPGHLAFLVLGDITKDDAYNLEVTGSPDGEFCRHRNIDFWDGVAQLAAGNIGQFQQAMQSTSDLTWKDFDENKSLFIKKLWGPEFFLARCEAERMSS